MYILINGDNTPYSFESIMPFTTQHGHKAIRIYGNTMPETSEGFKIYDDNGKVISDYSDYTYFYKEDEYSVVNDEISLPDFTDSPISPSAYVILNNRINKVNSRVTKITPYTMHKFAGIDETMCEFDYSGKGKNISAWMLIGDEQKKCSFELVDNKIIVVFEPLEEVATIYVSIQ